MRLSLPPAFRRLLQATRHRPGRAALGVLFLVGCTAVGLWLGGRQVWAEYHFRAGRTALERRAYDEADAHFGQALGVRPADGRVHFLRARLARQAGNYPEAERRLERCRKLGFAGEDVILESLLVPAQQGEMTVLIEERLRGMVNADHPDSPYILEALSRGYMRNYRLNDARDCLNVWLELRPDDTQALLGRGWVLERLDQFEKAADDYRRAAAVAPDLPEVEMRLGQVLLLAGTPHEALPSLERAVARRPDDPEAGVALAQCLARLSRHDEARDLLDCLAGKHPSAGPVLLERGALEVQAGRPADAEPWLRKALAAMPNDYQANYSLAQCLRQQGKDADARGYQARATEIETDLVRMRDLTDTLQRRPYDAELRCEIGQLFLRHGEPREGEMWLQSALRIQPGHRGANEALAKHYEARGDGDQAAKHRRLAEGAREGAAASATEGP
jgi:tetratricopeptide (TPR) repeat protein